ncbi:MAG: tRNA pseudouridine(55) synthase TruB [Chitinophagaceae bacterium]|nr:MAG: tRNA pseudouridine(55) synthase TruB [Chitinophagaceae bacterium]
MVFPDLDTLKEGATLLIDKPYEWTSFDVVNLIKRRTKAKTGHAGTLDPLATGLVILCTGKFTKKLQEFSELGKTYEGIIYLGAHRPSYDRETEIESTNDISGITEEQIQESAKTFIGEQLQMPPIFSAIKKDGIRAYKKARKGEHIEMTARKINIIDFVIKKVELPMVHFEVSCSKGTYIRSLAFDFGKSLNSKAYLHELRRTKIGLYDVKNAFTVEECIESIADQKMKQNNKPD